MVLLLLLVAVFVGFAIGRIGHMLGGHLNTPDHWIYGVLLVIGGIILYKNPWGKYLITLGIGHTISDLKDMLNLKFYGPDKVDVKKFWGID
jgi:hypothetical protein